MPEFVADFRECVTIGGDKATNDSHQRDLANPKPPFSYQQKPYFKKQGYAAKHGAEYGGSRLEGSLPHHKQQYNELTDLGPYQFIPDS